MSTGLYGIGWNGLGTISGHFAGRSWISVRAGLIWFVAASIAGYGGWMLLSGHSAWIANSKPVPTAMAVIDPAETSVAGISQDRPVAGPAGASELTSPVEGLRISSQHWRRGGLGANALVTFKLRNTNRYAVKDIEISCAFSRADGSHLTDRSRVIHETVRSRGRKVFQQLHVGFVNVNADRAKCSLIRASRV